MAFDNRRPIVQAIPFTKDGRERETSVCDQNSTSTPLGVDAIFTGAWVSVLQYTSISVLVRADQPSAVGGLKVEWSSDGVNVDDDDTYTIPANDGKFYSFVPEGRYIRISYTNGSTAQTEFRLQAIKRYEATKGSSHRLGDTVVDDDDGELVKAAVVGRDSSGVFQNITASEDAGVKRLAILGKVTVIGATPPPATTPAVIAADTPLVVGDHTTSFVIPDGETFHLQQLNCGNEDPSKGARVEVIYDDGTDHIVDRQFTAGQSLTVGFSDVSEARDGTVMVGNGSHTIKVRRLKFAGTNIAIDAVVRGYTI